jgi:hypothetical protein
MRTKGATSYTNVKIEDLAKVFNACTIVPVSRKWLEEMGVQITPPAQRVIEAQSLATQKPSSDNASLNTVADAPPSEAERADILLAGVAETIFGSPE